MASNDDLTSIFTTWLEALNARSTSTLSSLLSPLVTYNGHKLEKDAYISHVLSNPSSLSSLEMLTVDTSTSVVAARLIHRGTLTEPYLGAGVTGQPIEWTEHVLLSLDDHGQITRVQSMMDVYALRKTKAHVKRTPDVAQRPPPVGFDIKAMYNSYISCINARTMAEQFPSYVVEPVTHNKNVSSLEEYRLMIESSFSAIRGLHFDITELVADEARQHVAARLEFSGTPVGEFCGILPTGRDVRFAEHAYYKLDGGRIVFVWAMIDLEAYRKSLQGEL